MKCARHSWKFIRNEQVRRAHGMIGFRWHTLGRYECVRCESVKHGKARP